MTISMLEMPAQPHLIPSESLNELSEKIPPVQKLEDLSTPMRPINTRDIERLESISIPSDRQIPVNRVRFGVKSAISPFSNTNYNRGVLNGPQSKEIFFTSSSSKTFASVNGTSEEAILRAPLLMASIKRAGGVYVNRWEKEQLVLQQNYLLFATHTFPPTIVKCIDIRTIEKFEPSKNKRHPLRRKLVVKAKQNKSGRTKRETSRLQTVEIKFATLADIKLWDEALKKRSEAWKNCTEIAREFTDHASAHRLIAKFKHESKLAMASRFVASFSVMLNANYHACLQESFRRLHYNALTCDASQEIELLQRNQLDLRRTQAVTILQQIYSAHLFHEFYEFKSRVLHYVVNSERIMSRDVLVDVLLQKVEEHAHHIYSLRGERLSKALYAVYNRNISETLQGMRRIAFQQTVLREKRTQLVRLLLQYRQLHRRELLQNAMVNWESYAVRQKRHIQILANVLDNYLFHSMKKGFYCLYSHSLEKKTTSHMSLLKLFCVYQNSKKYTQRVAFFRWKTFVAEARLHVAFSVCNKLTMANATLTRAYASLPAHRGTHQLVFQLHLHTRFFVSMGWNALKAYTYRMRLKQKLSTAVNILLIAIIYPSFRRAFHDLNAARLAQNELLLQKGRGFFHLQLLYRRLQKEYLLFYWCEWLETDERLKEEAAKPSPGEVLMRRLEEWLQRSRALDSAVAFRRWRVYDERMNVMRDVTRIFCLHHVVGLADRLRLCVVAHAFFLLKRFDLYVPFSSDASTREDYTPLTVGENASRRHSFSFGDKAGWHALSLLNKREDEDNVHMSDETVSLPANPATSRIVCGVSRAVFLKKIKNMTSTDAVGNPYVTTWSTVYLPFDETLQAGEKIEEICTHKNLVDANVAPIENSYEMLFSQHEKIIGNTSDLVEHEVTF